MGCDTPIVYMCQFWSVILFLYFISNKFEWWMYRITANHHKVKLVHADHFKPSEIVQHDVVYAIYFVKTLVCTNS